MLDRRMRTVGIAACALLVAGCAREELQRNFGLIRDAPDEFVVTTRAPLSIPPDFTLRPPMPGATRPQEQSTAAAAEAALVPQAALAARPVGQDSPGQEALIAAAGPPAPPDIRQRVDAEAAKEAASASLTDKLMFWKSKTPPGVVVDAQKEAERLRENAALGRSPDTGDTPIISTRRKTLLDTLF